MGEGKPQSGNWHPRGLEEPPGCPGRRPGLGEPVRGRAILLGGSGHPSSVPRGNQRGPWLQPEGAEWAGAAGGWAAVPLLRVFLLLCSPASAWPPAPTWLCTPGPACPRLPPAPSPRAAAPREGPSPRLAASSGGPAVPSAPHPLAWLWRAPRAPSGSGRPARQGRRTGPPWTSPGPGPSPRRACACPSAGS